MLHYQFREPSFGGRQHQLAICQTIYDANAFDIKNWRKGFKVNPDMLPETVIKFLDLIKTLEIEFCIVGGIAYLAYIEDRNTKDLDILISVRDLDKILPFIEIFNQDVNFTNAEFEGLRIDFLKTSNSLFDYVQKNEATNYEFTEGKYPIATVEGLILMRIDAIIDLYQKGRWEKVPRYEYDLQMLTRNYEINWETIWETAAKFFTAGQINEFKKMIVEWQKPRTNPFLT